MSEENGVVIDGSQAINRFRVLQMKYSLRIEIETGMKHSQGSILKLVNRTFGQKFTRKVDAYNYLVELTEGKV